MRFLSTELLRATVAELEKRYSPGLRATGCALALEDTR